ncbi:hypothetical protein [Streptomyces sp. NPDC005322]|uniref:hypothetical protein n=1 Tax=Streptomyces sp. NPDC005322 TaxID=3157032 RepID=UPI0033A986D5
MAVPLGPWVKFRRYGVLLAGITGLRLAIALAGVLMPAIPLLVPRHDAVKAPP